MNVYIERNVYIKVYFSLTQEGEVKSTRNQISKMKFFAKIANSSKPLFFRKAPSQVFDCVLNAPLFILYVKYPLMFMYSKFNSFKWRPHKMSNTLKQFFGYCLNEQSMKKCFVVRNRIGFFRNKPYFGTYILSVQFRAQK